MNDILALTVLVFGVLIVALALRGFIRAHRNAKPPRSGGPPERAVHRRRAAPKVSDPVLELNPRSLLVDGSNVMHWIDNRPTTEALQRVLAALRNAGNDPILCFDANIGYKLVDSHLDPAELARFFGVAARNILVCPAGTKADDMILRLAVEHDLTVVSNDRYREYTDLAPKISRMTGQIKDGKVELRLRSPVTAS